MNRCAERSAAARARNGRSVSASVGGSQQGFSLAEFVVVSAIIMIITAVTLISWRSGSGYSALRRNAQLVSLDLRRAQQSALAATTFAGVTPCGYGVYFSVASVADRGRYVLFADLDRDFVYDAGVERIETTQLENGIRIESLTPAIASNDLTVFFYPPNPNTAINVTAVNCSGPNTIAEARITLALTSNAARTKSVRVTTVGLIEVE